MSRGCRLARVYGRFAWQAWGIVEDACVKRMVDEHFAWQACESGCMSALGKALEGGSAWQAWGIVHPDVAQCSELPRS